MNLRDGSLAFQIGELATGTSLSRTECIGLSSADLGDSLKLAKARMRNHLNKHAARASEATGNMYRLDTGTWLAGEDAAVFVTVAITRIA